MFKKKITKKSLDELAKVMPVIPEWEMKQMIGGVVFLTPSGDIICRAGTSDIMRIISNAVIPFDFNADHLSSLSEENALKEGVSLSSLSNLSDFSRGVMSNNGISLSSDSSVQWMSQNSPLAGSNDAITINTNNNIYVTHKSDSLTLDTYSNYVSTLRHEAQGHIGKRYMGTISGTTGIILPKGTVAEQETAAVMIQTQGAEWASTTYNYKTQATRYLVSLGVLKSIAAAMCGVSYYDLD